MNHPTETAKQIADLIRGDLIAAMQVREFISAADLIDLLGLHDHINAVTADMALQIETLRVQRDRARNENRRLERLLNGK